MYLYEGQTLSIHKVFILRFNRVNKAITERENYYWPRTKIQVTS